jgi:surface antigen
MWEYRVARNGFLVLLAAALAISAGMSAARAQDSTLLGAGAGAGGGAGIGFALGGPVGAVVGGLLGAGVGAGAGHAIGKDGKAREQNAATAGNLTQQVQQELIWAGYNPGPADGRFGGRTADAIRQYQANNALPQDGQPSVPLLDHLRAKRGAAQPQQVGYTPAPAPAAQPPAALPQMPAQAIDRSNCKPYETRTTIDGKEMVSKGTACLQSDGSWRTIN